VGLAGERSKESVFFGFWALKEKNVQPLQNFKNQDARHSFENKRSEFGGAVITGLDVASDKVEACV
jgi:hypothetical protein